MELENLKWDSDFFNMKIGKCEIDNEKEFNPRKFKEQAINEKFDLVYVFKDKEMLTSQTIFNANLSLVDIIITMSKAFCKNDYINLPYDFRRSLTNNELLESYQIAEQISIVSRFYKEEKIGAEKAKSLYRKWVDNTLNQSFADGLFIEKNSNSVTGINLIKTDRVNNVGYFTLTGVNSIYIGKEIGSKLWMQSFGYWANESEISIVKSKLSFQNLKSFNFHLKHGFQKIVETKFIYHFINTIF